MARCAADSIAALDMDDEQLQAIGRAARERALDEHTSRHRANSLVGYLEELRSPTAGVAGAQSSVRRHDAMRVPT